MSNSYFQFKQFRIEQDRSAMKVCTDACILGAFAAKRTPRDGYILDIGAGTGLLMLMLAQHTMAEIHGIEIQAGSFEQAIENTSRSSWVERLSVFHGDARAYAFPLQYDCIISNPPFYENGLVSEKIDKRLAMHSGELKLSELLNIIVDNLKATGSVYILLPFQRLEEFRLLSEKKSLYINEKLLVKQSPGHPWFRVICSCSFNNEKPTEVTELQIKEDNGDYSKEFKTLMKEYYLHL
jgi:tRNA1Val (adenine37-N6)-methyltransferase